MKIVEVLRIASLLLLPGAIASTHAQEREQEKQPEQKQQPAKPAQQPAKPTPQQHAQQPAKPAPQQRTQQPAKQAPQQRAQQPAKQAPQKQAGQQPAKPAEQQRAQQQVRPAQGQQQQANRAQPAAHGRIPDDRFRASFGREHTFHVNRADFAGGSRRFQYGGFWFAAANPWPVGWLYTDSVYVDYMNGGYFLCDPVHPGVFLSITIG